MKLSDSTKLVASGGLWFDGIGWWWEKLFILLGWMNPPNKKIVRVIKTLTLLPRKGNLKMWWPLKCIRFIHSNWKNRPAWQRWLLSFIPFGAVGVNNSVGLTNKGFYWWINKIWPKIKNREDLHIIVSIFGTIADLVEMAQEINALDDPNNVIIGIQINGACPNSGENLSENTDINIRSCEIVSSVSRLPLSLSVSAVHDIDKIIAGTMDIVELYTINSVPWSFVFGKLRSPLAKLGNGGVSGKVVQHITWKLAARMEKFGVAVAWPSIWESDDLEKMRVLGKAITISFGSVILCHPFRADKMMNQDPTKKGKLS